MNAKQFIQDHGLEQARNLQTMLKNLGSPVIQRRIAKGKQIGLSMSVSDTSGALNPDWVEWLMGWPIGWTGLKPLEMDRFQSWRKAHLNT